MKDIPQAIYVSMDDKEEAYSKILKMTGDFLEKYGISSWPSLYIVR